MRICKHCGADIVKGVARCVRCGYPVELSPQEQGHPDAEVALVPLVRVPEVEYAEVEYTVPILPSLEEDIPARRELSAYIDSEGWITEWTGRGDRIRKIDVWLYKYYYSMPEVGFKSITREMTEYVAELIGEKVYKVKEDYVVFARGRKAISVMLYIRPYVRRPKLKKRIEYILKRYKHRPSVRVPPTWRTPLPELIP